MELHQLEYAVDAAASKSFSKTAKHHYVTQQTVSKAIFKLELELGFSLFERTYAGVEPVDSCSAFFDQARSLLHEVDKLRTVAEEIKEGASRSIRVCFPLCTIGTQGRGAIPYESIEWLKHEAVNQEVNCIELPSFQCVEGVLSGEFDFGVAVGQPDAEGLECLPLVSCGCKVLVAKGDRLAEKAEISFGDLEKVSIVPPPDRAYSLDVIVRRCRSYGFDPLLTESFDQLSTIMEMVYAGRGVSFIMPFHEALVDRARAVLVPLQAADALVISLVSIWKQGGRGESWARSFTRHYQLIDKEGLI